MKIMEMYGKWKEFLNTHPSVRALMMTLETGAVTFFATTGYNYFKDGSIFTKAGFGQFIAAFASAEYIAFRLWFVPAPAPKAPNG